MYLFSLPNTLQLAKRICQNTRLETGSYSLKYFSDGEIYLRLKNKVKNQTVYLLGSTYQPNNNIIELLILINALKVNGAKKIIAIIPYFGYARQDRADQVGAPISAELMTRIFKHTGINQFITIDIHSQRDKHYLGSNLINLEPYAIFSDYIKKKISLNNTIIVAPDNGAKNKAINLARLLDPLPVLVMQKIRPKQNQAKIIKFKQNIKGKNIIIIDDLIDTAGTITAACQELKKHQVKDIYIFATHGVFSGQAMTRLNNSPVKEIVITDTYPLLDKKISKKIKILSILNLLTKHLNN